MRIGLTALAIVVLATTASAQSSFQITPDNRSVLMQRRVGDQQWVVLLRGANAYGNVYFSDGTPPAFVSCDVSFPDSGDVAFACRGADACTEEECLPYRPLDEVTLPASFFRCTAGDPHPVSGMFALNCPAEPAMRAPGGPSESSPSGVRYAHDGRFVMFQKDVGAERWSVFYDPQSHVVFGSVLRDDGGASTFLGCAALDESDDEIAYECFAAPECVGSCTSESYESIGEVSLPRSLFGVPMTELPIADGVRAGAVEIATDGTNYAVAYSDGSPKVQRIDVSGVPLDEEPILVAGPPLCEALEEDVPPEFLPWVQSRSASITFLQDHFHVTWSARAGPLSAGLTRTMTPEGSLDACAGTAGRSLSVGNPGCLALRAAAPSKRVVVLDRIVTASHSTADCLPANLVTVVGRKGSGDEFNSRSWDLPISVFTPVVGEVGLASTGRTGLVAWWSVELETGAEASPVQLRMALRSLAPRVDLVFPDSQFDFGARAPLLGAAAVGHRFLVVWLDGPHLHTMLLSERGDELGRGTIRDVAIGDAEYIMVVATDEQYLVAWAEASGAARLDLRGLVLDGTAEVLRGPFTLAERVTGRIGAEATDNGFLLAFFREGTASGDELYVRPVPEH